ESGWEQVSVTSGRLSRVMTRLDPAIYLSCEEEGAAGDGQKNGSTSPERALAPTPGQHLHRVAAGPVPATSIIFAPRLKLGVAGTGPATTPVRGDRGLSRKTRGCEFRCSRAAAHGEATSDRERPCGQSTERGRR